MKKKHKSFSRLKKSTVITIVSCGSFVVMTFLALLFFVRFPIKPSEKIISSMGRSGIYRQNVSYSDNTTTTTTTTQTVFSVTETDTRQTTTASTTHKEFIITITTGKGFKTGFEGHDVPVMDYDYYDYDYSYTTYVDKQKETTTTTVTYNNYYDDDYDYNDYIW